MGRVLMPNGNPVAGAEVTATDSDGISRMVVADEDGTFVFSDMTIGQSYTLTARAEGLRFTAITVGMTDRMAGIDLIALQ